MVKVVVVVVLLQTGIVLPSHTKSYLSCPCSWTTAIQPLVLTKPLSYSPWQPDEPLTLVPFRVSLERL